VPVALPRAARRRLRRYRSPDGSPVSVLFVVATATDLGHISSTAVGRLDRPRF